MRMKSKNQEKMNSKYGNCGYFFSTFILLLFKDLCFLQFGLEAFETMSAQRGLPYSQFSSSFSSHFYAVQGRVFSSSRLCY